MENETDGIEGSSILIAEDTPSLARLLEVTLTSKGYRCRIAENGRIAREILEKGEEYFDAVVSDNEMPEMTGMELAKWLRAEPQLCHLPFILVTGKIDDRSFAQAINEGIIDAYLSKPCPMNSITNLVSVFIDRNQRRLLAPNDYRQLQKIIR